MGKQDPVGKGYLDFKSIESQVGRAFLDALDMLKTQLAINTVEYLRENTPEMSVDQVRALITHLEFVVDKAGSDAVPSVIKAAKD